MSTTRASRIGKRIGSWLFAAVNIGTGYFWARYGFLVAFYFWGGFLVVVLALYGALKFPWGETS